MGIEKNGAWASNLSQQVCFSSGSLLPSGRSIFVVGLRVSQSRKFGSRIRSCGAATGVLVKAELGGSSSHVGLEILEKEFEFKPSFDEYLKVLESVKTNRDKEKVQDSTRKKTRSDSRKNGVSRTLSLETGKKNVNLAELEESMSMDKSISKVKEFKKIEIKDHSARRGHGSIRHKLSDKESNRDASARRKVGVDNNENWARHDGLSVKQRRNHHEFEKDTSGISGQSQFGSELSLTKVSSKNDTLKNDKLRQSSRIVPSGDIDDEEITMDRAAFRTLEEYDGVYGTPRVSQVDMEARIQRLAKCLNGADIDIPEWKFSKMMRSARIRYSDHSIIRIIQILGNLGNWKRVLQVIEWIQARERFKSHKIRYIYTAALDALRKARRPVEAFNVFQAMQQQMPTYPDLVAYHSIAVTLGQAGHMKELFDVIDRMQSAPKRNLKSIFFQEYDPRLEPDIVVYNAVLNACVKRKKWEGAFWVLQQLKQRNIQPSGSTYGLVMEVMFVSGKYSLVHDFFNKVKKASMSNALTYKVLVNTLWREGKIDEAVLAVQEMEMRGIVGTSALYYDLARCLCSAGRCSEALIQIEKICKVASKPLVVTYTGLIQACLDSGNIQNGEYVFNHMHKFCSPNIVTCNIMLKAFLDHGMFEKAYYLFENLLDNSRCISNESDYMDKVIPDSYSFNLMLEACFVEQRWDDLDLVYGTMLQYGYHFNAKRHLRFILDAARAGKVEMLEKTWNALVCSGRAPTAILVKEWFRLKLQENDYAAALSCIAGQSLDNIQGFSRKSWLKFFMENASCLRKETISDLLHEISILVARSDYPNIVFQNLFSACGEYLKSNVGTSEVESIKKEQLVESQCEAGRML